MKFNFSSSNNLVNNDPSAYDFLASEVFRTLALLKFSSFTYKRYEETTKNSAVGVSSPLENSKGFRIQGLATTHNNSDFVHDVIAKDAFRLQCNDNGIFLKCHIPAMYYEHCHKKIIGFWDYVEITKLGIEVEGSVTDENIINLIVNDSISNLSIGFFAIDYQKRCNMIKNKIYRYITRAKLVEISLVKNPANSSAFFSPVDPLYFGTTKSLSQHLFNNVQFEY